VRNPTLEIFMISFFFENYGDQAVIPTILLCTICLYMQRVYIKKGPQTLTLLLDKVSMDVVVLT